MRTRVPRPSCPRRTAIRRPRDGVTLLETILATLVAGVLVLGVLAAWDLAARTNKSEIEIADAQGSARSGSREIARVVAMAGAGGLFVTQAVLVRPDAGLPGVSIPDGDYDNVPGGTITDLADAARPIRPGTDVLEVRGVFYGPLLALDSTSGCGRCDELTALTLHAVTETGHVNHGARRPQFSRVDDVTRGASDRHPMLVLVAGGEDLHAGCSGPAESPGPPPQPRYAVGRLSAPTALASAGSFGQVDFTDPLAREFTTEDPGDVPPAAAPLAAPRRAGVLDDVLFFVDDTDPRHPQLARAIRRGRRFDVVAIADEVEDMQVAYGVDGLYGSDGVPADGALRRLVAPSENDPDPEFSTRPDGDEWAPNAPGERLFETSDFQSMEPAPAGFPHRAISDAHCPRLSAVAVSLVAKSRDPEPSYRGPDAAGIRSANSPDAARTYPTPPESPRYRRRLQTVRVALRNFGG